MKWFGCACCPPNIARLLSSIGSYAYSLKENTIFMHLYMGGEISTNLSNNDVIFNVETEYPWNDIDETKLMLSSL